MRQGLTFLELMVTVGMVVLVLTLSSVSYRTASKRMEIIYTAQALAGEVRQMQSFAASSKAWKNQAAANAWGLFVDKSEPQIYRLFVDVNGDKQYQADTELYKTIALPKQIAISGLRCLRNAGAQEADKAAAVFNPPAPSTDLRVESENCDVLYITLNDAVNNSQKIIAINFFGLIDVER